MRDGAVAAEVQVVRVRVHVHVPLFHGGDELVVVGFSLGAADDLADAGDQEVRRRDGLPVVVLFHVERLDVFRVVDDEDRFVEDLLGDVPLMFGLQVHAPGDRELEVRVGLLEEFDGFRVVEDLEVRVHDVLQLVEEAFLHELVEELEFRGAALHDGADDIFHHVLGDFEDVRQFGERDLRFDVPEFGDVPLGVGLLRAEGRAEGVDLAEGRRGHLALELSRDGQAGLLAKEVVRVVVLGALVVRLRAERLRGDFEHLPRAFRVGPGDERGVDIDITVLLEVFMDGGRQRRAHMEHRIEGVRAQTDVRHGAQELERVAFLLQRVVRGAVAEQFDLRGVDLHAALFVHGARHDRAGDAQRHAQPEEVRERIALGKFGFIDDDLDVFERGPVVEFGERHGLRVPGRADPAADGHFFPDEAFIGHDIPNVDVFHESLPPNVVL